MTLEDGLISADALTRRGYGAIVKNTGKVIAIITLALALLLSFTDIKLSDLGTAELTSNIVLMLICSLVMFFSLEDAGERLCEGGEEYKSALADYESIASKIGGDDIGPLREFCEEYSRRELIARRGRFLLRYGLSKEEYEEHLAGGRLEGRKRRLARRASRLRAAPLSPSVLLTSTDGGERGELYDPSRFKLLRMGVKLLPTIACTTLTVSVALSMKEGLDMAVIIESVIRLLTLPIVGLRGYASGYSFAKEHTIPRIKTKARILNSFLHSSHKGAIHENS